MRMRKKRNLLPRMERCAFVQIEEPQEKKGRWLHEYAEKKRLYLELGCGKGQFTAELAAQNRDTLVVAVERVPEAMVVAMERACKQGLDNALFIDMDAALLEDVFAEGEVGHIYINFCDPWPTKKHAKRRLTSGGFLAVYRKILHPGGEIRFKTDNTALFAYSVEQFAACGFTLHEVTEDLHASGPVGIMTDYEQKFHEAGTPICRCVARLPEGERE